MFYLSYIFLLCLSNKLKANILPQLITDNFNNANGITQLSIIFSMFIKLYENQVKFLRYIYFFDSYAVRIKMEKERLMDYEKTIESTKNVIAASISKGIFLLQGRKCSSTDTSFRKYRSQNRGMYQRR